MSTLLSMLTLVPGGMGGSETYARELVQELSTRHLPVSALVAPAAQGFTRGQLPEAVASEYLTGPRPSDRIRALVVGTVRRRALRRHLAGASVIHFPFTVPVPPPLPSQRTVVTLLDVQHLELPDLFSRGERLYRRWAYDKVARDADAVITISNHAKQRIVEYLGIDPERIFVAPLGVRGDEFAPCSIPRERVVLYPAKGWPHKNHATLFAAWRLFHSRHPSHTLVLTGAQETELPPLPEGVQSRGLIDRSELVHLYQTAAVMVFPSRYEGFGLPIVEAMSAGCPVAASSVGAVQEVVGDAGILFNPEDPNDIARGIEAALDGAKELAARGFARAASFSWSACADVHEDVYRDLGGLEPT